MYLWKISFAPRLSPKDSRPKITLNDLKLEVEYNRPSKRERDIFGALVPYDRVWRTGANEATTFETNKDLLIDSMVAKVRENIPYGPYRWKIPGK